MLLFALKIEEGEGWGRVGEGSTAPFTRINIYILGIYIVLMKGEGCF